MACFFLFTEGKDPYGSGAMREVPSHHVGLGFMLRSLILKPNYANRMKSFAIYGPRKARSVLVRTNPISEIFHHHKILHMSTTPMHRIKRQHHRHFLR